MLVLGSVQAGCTRPDEHPIRRSDDDTMSAPGGSTTPVAVPTVTPTNDPPRLAGEPMPPSIPADHGVTSATPASASASGSAKPPPPPPPNPNPPPLPGKIAPAHRPTSNDRI